MSSHTVGEMTVSEQPEQPSPKASRIQPEAEVADSSADTDSRHQFSEPTDGWDIEDLPTELILPPELSNVFEDSSVLTSEEDAPSEELFSQDNAILKRF